MVERVSVLRVLDTVEQAQDVTSDRIRSYHQRRIERVRIFAGVWSWQLIVHRPLPR